METKYVETAISNDKLEKLIILAKSGDKSAMTEIINLYHEEIQNSSKYIKMNKEDAFQSIVADFIELLINDRQEVISYSKERV